MLKKIIILLCLLFTQGTVYETGSRILPNDEIYISSNTYLRPNQKVTRLIGKYSEIYNVPYKIASAVARVESNYIKSYKNYNPYVMSSKGAFGVYQIMLPTARWFRDENISDVELLYNLDLNVSIGVEYLHYLNKNFSDWRYALAAYNYGIGNVMDTFTGDFSIDSLNYPIETQQYLEKISTLTTLY